MLLVTGPPSSGKTTYCLDRVREHLRRNYHDCCLLVPTATLAEHLRNQLAREGYVFPPDVVTTFSKFADSQTVSTARLEIITGEVLAHSCPPRYALVADFKGFRKSLAAAIDEYLSAGGTPSDLPPQAADFGNILTQVVARAPVPAACRFARPAKIYLTGFFSFNNPELKLIESLCRQAEVTVTLPEWPGSEAALKFLRPTATEEIKLAAPIQTARRTLVTASTLDAEVNEVVRRILAEHDSGRAWRDMAIIVRTEDPYVPALRSALDRFGIPSRFYFGTPLAQLPMARYLSALVDAMLDGWQHEATLEALRLSGSPLEHDDRFDYSVRERLPGQGLAELAAIAGPEHATFFEQLPSWSAETALPAAWAERFQALSSLFRTPPVRDRVTQEQILILRSYAAAAEAWAEALVQTADALLPGPITCAQFRNALDTVLHATDVRPPDHRRDVVHVIDAFEARQWRLPVIFICGLIEKQFPRYHSENPILGDDIRRHLQARGIQLRTSLERQSDEQFLFDCVLSRATEAVFLTYPVLNAKADSNLASFLLARAEPYATETAVDVRPAPQRQRAPEARPVIYDESLRERFIEKHSTIAASAVETYLQCPYQFFSQRSLNLKEAPPDPWDRLNPVIQGNIVHAVLERYYRERRDIRQVFDQVFSEFSAKGRIPAGYRTEAIRLDLFHNIRLLVDDQRLKPGVRSIYEQSFDLPLGDGTTVRGRIDRIEVDPSGRATVFDYKYSGKFSVNRTKAGHDEKTRVQGGLYLIALSNLGPYVPAGMVYCGFKREVSFGGWIIRPYYSEIAQDCTEDELQNIMHLAREAALETAHKIRQGNIRPAPVDEARCEWCAYERMCRNEVAPALVHVQLATS